MKGEIRDSVIDNVGGSDYHSGILGSGGREKMSVETGKVGIERLLTVQDICELLEVPRSYVYRLTHTKRIPYMKIQGHLRFRRAHIDEWLRSQEVREKCRFTEENLNTEIDGACT